MRTGRLFPFHPFLLAAYPVLALLANNLDEVSLSTSLRPLAISVLGAAVLFLVLRLLFRDWPRAAIAASAAVALFFAYGHVYNFLEGAGLFGFTFGRHRILFPLWALLLAAVLFWLARTRRDLLPADRALNLVAVIALVFPLSQIGLTQIQSAAARPAEASVRLTPPPEAPLPDIYYIVLDAYARQDTLNQTYGFDNRPFLDELARLGFTVIPCSQSNYAHTQLSLASTLNFNYLEAISDRYTAGSASRLGLPELIKHSAARRLLESLGYQTIAFETGFEFTEIKDAGLYLSPQSIPSLNDFETLLLRTTAARVVLEGTASLDLEPRTGARAEAHRRRVLHTLSELPNLPLETPAPRFVFAHIVSPHWPYVFGPNGEPVAARGSAKSAYIDQITFLNKQIVPILEAILARSTTPPIIILQADHGSVIENLPRRMNILSAYYLPAGGDTLLYENISPVNTFRLLFNHYFNAGLPLLEDRANFSLYDTPYDYQLIQDTRPGCAP